MKRFQPRFKMDMPKGEKVQFQLKLESGKDRDFFKNWFRNQFIMKNPCCKGQLNGWLLE